MIKDRSHATIIHARIEVNALRKMVVMSAGNGNFNEISKEFFNNEHCTYILHLDVLHGSKDRSVSDE